MLISRIIFILAKECKIKKSNITNLMKSRGTKWHRQVSFESKCLWKILDIQSNLINWQQMLKFSRVSDNFYLQRYPKKKKRWKHLGYVFKNEARASAVAGISSGSWRKLKGWLKEFIREHEQTENLWDLTRKRTCRRWQNRDSDHWAQMTP